MEQDWIEEISSAWKGHRKFAEWLVKRLQPKILVELGVDYGYSTCVFGKVLKDNNIEGKLIGVDHFKGDQYTSYRDTYDLVVERIKDHELSSQITLVKKDFAEYSTEFTDTIDILHIDGLHTYTAVKNDYKNWSKFVGEKGIILFHDVCVPQFGVKDFFREVRYPNKLYFTHSAGLGILTKDNELAEEILEEFGTKGCKDFYKEPI